MFEPFKDAVGIMLAGLGITFAPHMYFGGLFLALGGCLVTRQFSDVLRETPRSTALLTTLFLSTVTAGVSHSFSPDIPIQIGMAVTGMLSVPLAKRISSRSQEVVDSGIDKIVGGSTKDNPKKEIL